MSGLASLKWCSHSSLHAFSDLSCDTVVVLHARSPPHRLIYDDRGQQTPPGGATSNLDPASNSNIFHDVCKQPNVSIRVRCTDNVCTHHDNCMCLDFIATNSCGATTQQLCHRALPAYDVISRCSTQPLSLPSYRMSARLASSGEVFMLSSCLLPISFFNRNPDTVSLTAARRADSEGSMRRLTQFGQRWPCRRRCQTLHLRTRTSLLSPDVPTPLPFSCTHLSPFLPTMSGTPRLPPIDLQPASGIGATRHQPTPTRSVPYNSTMRSRSHGTTPPGGSPYRQTAQASLPSPIDGNGSLYAFDGNVGAGVASRMGGHVTSLDSPPHMYHPLLPASHGVSGGNRMRPVSIDPIDAHYPPAYASSGHTLPGPPSVSRLISRDLSTRDLEGLIQRHELEYQRNKIEDFTHVRHLEYLLRHKYYFF